MRAINCIHNEEGCFCTNGFIPRSFGGIGARVCMDFVERKEVCALRIKRVKPNIQVPKQ